jgi:hypothetical protein
MATEMSKAVEGSAFPHIDVSAVVEAVNTLKALLNCGNPRVEVSAARTILELSNKFIEDDLKERVNLLESGLCGRLKRH